MHPIKHFKTITSHKLKVMKYCFKIGLYKQGLLHDLSKYSPTEFIPGAKYYVGTHSPIDEEKKDIGFSYAWLHHKGHNPHHIDYWIDKNRNGFYYIEIPKKYIKEMVCDRISASQTYLKDQYTDAHPYEFFMNGIDKNHMHPNSSALLGKYLKYIKDYGLEEGLKMIKKD